MGGAASSLWSKGRSKVHGRKENGREVKRPRQAVVEKSFLNVSGKGQGRKDISSPHHDALKQAHTLHILASHSHATSRDHGSPQPPPLLHLTPSPAVAQTLSRETSSRAGTQWGRSKGRHGRGQGLPAPSSAPVPRQLLKRPARISQGQLKG